MRAKLKPAKPGLIVRDPKTRRPLPEEGREVNLDSFWRRRLRDGDVVEVKSAPPAKAAKAAVEPKPAAKSEG